MKYLFFLCSNYDHIYRLRLPRGGCPFDGWAEALHQEQPIFDEFQKLKEPKHLETLGKVPQLDRYTLDGAFLFEFAEQSNIPWGIAFTSWHNGSLAQDAMIPVYDKGYYANPPVFQTMKSTFFICPSGHLYTGESCPFDGYQNGYEASVISRALAYENNDWDLLELLEHITAPVVRSQVGAIEFSRKRGPIEGLEFSHIVDEKGVFQEKGLVPRRGAPA